MINEKLPFMFYGGDYNPDQWPEEVLEEDIRLFKKANINVVTLPVFSWAKLQPSEEVYDFQWLDRIMDKLAENDLYVCLATSTAAQPAWMSKKYPEMLPVDFDGRKRKHGGRVNFCPTSEIYKDMSTKLTRKLAERYKNHPGLLLWHIGNEYGNYCYCDHCEEEFRIWLKKRYGTIENLNKAWNMSFWGHTVYEFDEIVVPSGISEMWKDNGRDRSNFQGISLDYHRFMSEAIFNCYLEEYKIIKEITPDLCVTTNLMGTFKPLDYFKWAEKMDVISWDNYPQLIDPMYVTALRHDLMRGLKDGKPFMLMEQTPSQQNWQPYNGLKRPGVMRLQSYQAVAHGADTVMFFQLRRSIGACEKYHGAVIEHVGHEDTRVFRECTKLGEELTILKDKIIDSRIEAKVAIVFDWENWWAVELSSGPTIELNYLKQIEKYYKAFHDKNISIDFVKSEADFSKYDVVIAPLLYMVKKGVADNIENFVENGGTFITTFFSGIVNENDLVTLGGYPGELRKVLGIWVEEIDALFPHMKNSIKVVNKSTNLSDEYSCGMLCDILHLEGAEALALYGSDFYKDFPVITENKFGKGKAYYIASDPEELFINDFIQQVCNEKNISSNFENIEGVEITERVKGDCKYIFILNHNEYSVEIKLDKNVYVDLLTGEKKLGLVTIDSKDLLILEEKIATKLSF
ncbi:beta-galactosidase [Clostridium folliculivorans]|uniref:Beta-galactosidase n=1 Tax=Clostridium folliculivorans TaxID=2886038 RepID=A0A9W5Y0S1_9CLOT|nr:beta-galactosidase [Clostridium folliculivorans]GKU24523.1 beta-galactosidase [Clostridium folliculivorans]GKU30621.1 beta-galactosidase [Clostridium folliculivorans]